MLQAKKPTPEIEPSTNRIKLPPESGIRPLSGIKELLAQAGANRGAQIELTWTADKPDHIFVLDVQWDPNLEDPFWSLYEDNAGTSNKVWEQPFAPSNIELLYDVLVMSCGAVAHSNKLSDILKAQPPSTKEDWSKPLHSQSGLPASSNSPSSDSTQKAKTTVTSQPGVSAEAKPAAETNNQNITQPPAPPPGYAYPPYPPAAGATMPGTGFPAAAYNLPPNMPSVAFPMPYPPPNMLPGQPFVMAPPVVAPPGWQYGPPTGANSSPPTLSPLPGNPYVQPAHQPLSDQLSALPVDANLFSKNSEISLANLLREAELITEPSLAAALKIQDLVQEGSLAVDKAVKVLKNHHSKGQAIGNYIDSPVTSTAKESPPAKSPPSRTPTTSTPKSKTVTKEMTAEMTAAFDLLETAGLLSKQDMDTAHNVSRKHGGNLVSILQAAKSWMKKPFLLLLLVFNYKMRG